MGASGESVSQSGTAARGNRFVLRDVCLSARPALYAAAQAEHFRRTKFFSHGATHPGDTSTSSVQHRDSATQAAETRTAGAVGSGTAPITHNRELQPSGTFHPVLW